MVSCHLAAVEGVTAPRGDALERVGEPGIREDLALLRRVSGRKEGLGETGVARELLRALSPVPGDQLAHWRAFARLGDRWSEHLLHGELAEACMQLEPPIDAPGHGHGQWATLGDLLQPLTRELLERQPARRTAARVQSLQRSGARVPDHGEQISAQPGTRRLEESRASRSPRSPRRPRCRRAGGSGARPGWRAAGSSPPCRGARSLPSAWQRIAR